MKRAVLVSCACLLAAPVAAQTGTADKKLLKETARTMVEDRTRQDFEEAQNKVSQRDKDAMDCHKNTLLQQGVYLLRVHRFDRPRKVFG